ncbi:MAG: TolC family protein, partial [Pseudomonadota bacterium]
RPQDLVRLRADVRAGYARLRQVAAEVGIRFAERLPTLQVTASWTSLTEKALSSEWLGHGLNLAAPLFEGGRLRGFEQRARHALEAERQRYLELWLTALQEVTVLTKQFQQQRRVLTTLQERRSFAQQALQAARNRYTLGDQNYLAVLTALRGVQEADRQLVVEQRELMRLWIEALEATGQWMCEDAAQCQHFWAL